MRLWFEKGAWASKNASKKAVLLAPEEVKSIAVIRHAAIGDMVIVRPFIIELKKFFPNAKITLSIVDHYSYGAPVDLVDRVHTIYKKKDGVKTGFFDRLKQIKELGEHDLLFNQADTSMSDWVTLLNKAKLKIGFPYHRIKNYLYFDVSILRSDLAPEMEVLLQMLYVFGARDTRPLDFAYPKYKVKRKDSYIVYFTSASDEGKCWPHFRGLVKKMAEAYPEHQHLMLEGIRADEKIELNELEGMKNIAVAPALPFDDAMRFLAESSLVISNDTGVRNMAIAIGANTLGIFFSTIPYRYWPRDGKHEVVFNADRSIPDVKKVFTYTQEHLTKLK